MEGSSSQKPLTANDIEDLFGSKNPNLLASSSSSSKPPLGPVPLPLKITNNNSNSPLFPTVEAVITGNKSQQDKKEKLQTPTVSSAQKNNNNVTLNLASYDQYHLEAKNQFEPTTKVSDNSEEARRLRRVMSNRMSAQRSRFRKLQYEANLEKQYAQLKNQIAFLKPQIEAFTNLKDTLMLEQAVLAQRFAVLENETLFRQAEIERNQAEVYELRELEKQQKEAEAQAMMTAFANLDTHPNVQEIFVDTDILAPGFGNVAEMLEIEEDEHTMDLDNFSPMNELNVIVNSPKPNDNDADS